MYECYNCGYIIKDKTKMRNHLNRKRICKKIRENINLNNLKELILQGISYQEYLNLKNEKCNVSVDVSEKAVFVSENEVFVSENEVFLKNSAISTYICNYCSKEYKHRQSLYTHTKICKQKKQTITTHENTTELCSLLQQQLYKTFKQLDNKDKQITKLIKKSNHNINNGTIQNNNNIVINSYKTPDLSHLTSKDIYSCLSKNVFCAAELIEKIYFNKDKPENHNICLTNLKTSYISVFDGTNWNVQKKVIAFDDLLDHCENTFTDFVAEWNGKYPETVAKFNKFLDRIYDDADALRKNIYEDLTYKMYNNSKKLNIKI
jgi:hypothetical protein